MNGSAFGVVPAVAPVVQMAPEAIRTVEQRQEAIIRNTTALQEAALDDMTEAGLKHMQGLIDQIGVDLAYCRLAANHGGKTGT